MKKFIAVVAIAAALLGTACSAQSRQDKANAAAAQVASYIAAGDDGSLPRDQAVASNIEKATGCKYVGLDGGPIPTDAAQRAAFVKQVQTSIIAYVKAHPGYIVGVSLSGKVGAVIVIDCSGVKA